jgi:hypothetical protein
MRPHPRNPSKKRKLPLNRRQVIVRVAAVAIVVVVAATLIGGACAHGLEHHHHVRHVLAVAGSVTSGFATITTAILSFF